MSNTQINWIFNPQHHRKTKRCSTCSEGHVEYPDEGGFLIHNITEKPKRCSTCSEGHVEYPDKGGFLIHNITEKLNAVRHVPKGMSNTQINWIFNPQYHRKTISSSPFLVP
jgi:hypothetical protein